MRPKRHLGLWALVLLAGGCGSTPERPPVKVGEALTDPRAGERMSGVAVAGRSLSRDQVPRLIELLDDPDPAVRLAAGATLRDLTGHDTGYRPWDDAEERRRHVDAWRSWYAGRTPRPVVARPAPPSVAPRPPAPAPAPGALPPPVVRVVEGRS